MPSFSELSHRLLIACLCLACWSVSPLCHERNVFGTESFPETVLPFVKAYCVECHNSKKSEGDLDLSKYGTTQSVAADYRKWEHVVTFVTREEMPPPDAKQPNPAERKAALNVLGKLMLQEARKTAGDPGVVLPRRLSNAEFNNAIRDLTGVDIRPADSFPIDPASGEGFSNTGEALVMSPSLFKKYYAAAQHVADHALLTPTQMSFAPHPVVTFADQTKLTEQAILKFYEQHKVDYAKYLTAAWQYRHRPSDRRAATVKEWAKESQLSPKYFGVLWAALQGDGDASAVDRSALNASDRGAINDKFFLKWLQQRFEALPHDKRDDAAIRSLANDIQKLSRQLCLPETEAIVGNAGNGPVQHIDRRTKTAANRDTFNPAAVTDSRQLHAEVSVVADKPLSIVLRATTFGGASDEAFVVIKGLTFSTSAPNQFKRNESAKNLSLQKLLADHAPDELKRIGFGIHPLGQAVDAESIVLKVPSVVTIEIPAKAFGDAKPKHVYADAVLDRMNSKSGTCIIDMLSTETPGWNDRLDSFATLPFVNPEHAVAQSFAASGAAFSKLFPNRFYFADDTRGLSAGFHLIEGFFRDDQPLTKLVLSEDENRELNRLWDELDFVTGVSERMLRGFVFFERSERNFMKHPDFDSIKEEDPELTSDATMLRFEQIYLRRSGVKDEPISKWSEAIKTGRADDVPDEIKTHAVHIFFDGIRQSIKRRATQWPAAAPAYLKRLLEFARAAYRRPLTGAEQQKLTAFFTDAAKPESLGIEQAVRATVVRILVSPLFCYLAEAAPAGDTVKPLPDYALASRLSFFLWASIPDEELLTLAEAGQLNHEDVLRAQTRRMLKSPKVSGFALEFFGQWLNYRDFRQAEAVNRTVFPAFDDALKQAMFEEPTRLASHVLQNDLPITELLRSDATFVNKRLAQHYGLPFDGPHDDWKLATGLHQQGRGGLLGMAVFLTKNSQPQRTSPVKRGFWVIHKLLGEHIPPPPPDVAVLPAKETDTNGKTIRQLLALHTGDVKCARCHVRFDPIGLAMEGFDSIGRSRAKDLAGRPIDNVVQLQSGEQARGVSEFSEYLAKHRRSDFSTTLNRKLLGYALGRSLQLSDLDLLEKMEATLQETDYRVAPLFETLITSPVFRNQRCRDF
ncbi:MAG: DUF1592 domain-containing protein [Planctomycetia bacterium]|nr:DUF1592 domain-containing protein [Planctomycetia bacterium]